MHEVLEEGDCAWMESEMALSWTVLGKHRCRVLAVSCGTGRTSASAERNSASAERNSD
jgi:hypothetical protein